MLQQYYDFQWLAATWLLCVTEKEKVNQKFQHVLVVSVAATNPEIVVMRGNENRNFLKSSNFMNSQYLPLFLCFIRQFHTFTWQPQISLHFIVRFVLLSFKSKR